MNKLFFDEEKEFETYEVPKKPSHFDILKKLKNRKTDDNDIKYFNTFLFLKQYSNNQNLIGMINFLNVLNIDNEKGYLIASEMLPKLPYIGFPKSKKEKPTKDIESIMWYFKVNFETAKRYLEFIDKDMLKEIKFLFKEKN